MVIIIIPFIAVTVLPEPIMKNVEDALLESSSQKSVPLEHIEKEVGK